MTFTAENLCLIIKACSEAGVSKLSLGQMHLEFGRPASSAAFAVGTPAPEPSTPAAPPVAIMTESQHEKLNEQALTQAEVNVREQQIAELLITDPLAAEEMISNQELTPDG